MVTPGENPPVLVVPFEEKAGEISHQLAVVSNQLSAQGLERGEFW